MNPFQIIGLFMFGLVALVLVLGAFARKFGEAGYFIFLILAGSVLLIIGSLK